MRKIIYQNKPSFEILYICALFSYIIYLFFLICFEGLWLQYLWIILSIFVSYFLLAVATFKTTIFEDSVSFYSPTKILKKNRIIQNDYIKKVRYSHGISKGLPYPLFRIYYSLNNSQKLKKRIFQLHKEDDPLVLLNHFKNLNIPIDFYTQYEEEEKWEKEFKTVK